MENVLGLVNPGGVNKKAEAVEQFFKWSEHAGPAADAGLAAGVSFLSAPNTVQRGTCLAWGRAPSSAFIHTASATEVCAVEGFGVRGHGAEASESPGTGGIAASDAPRVDQVVRTELTAAVDAMDETLRVVATALRTDDLGTAGALFTGTAADAHPARRRQLRHAVDLAGLLQRVSLEGDGQVTGIASELDHADLRFRSAMLDLLEGVTLGRFSGSSDPRYQTERRFAEDQLGALRAAVRSANRLAPTHQPALDGVAVIDLMLDPPRSSTTGAGVVGSPGEQMVLSGRVRNLGSVPAEEVTVRLVLEPDLAVRAVGPQIEDLGTLAPNDGQPGGADEATVEFVVEHDGTQFLTSCPSRWSSARKPASHSTTSGTPR